MPKPKLTPHPHALLLPELTQEEYTALKSDIKQHGILYPIIVDENNQILDGVHRHRIANELHIDLPIQRHKTLSEDRKLHLAVGLNMRRRHLDADRRRELVRKLHHTNRLSLRRIADVTGWSKSTIERDLKTSPYEEIIGSYEASIAKQQAQMEEIKDPGARKAISSLFGSQGEILNIFQYTDSQWKRGNWPLSIVEQAQMDLALKGFVAMLEFTIQALSATTPARRQRVDDDMTAWKRAWNRDERRLARIANDPVKLQRWAEQYDNDRDIHRLLKLDTGVPNGTPTVTATTTGECAYCGEEFERARSTKRYCSDAHRQMAYRERQR